MEVDCSSEPDSTTAEREFAINDDVLCRMNSNSEQMYLGVIVKVEVALRKCQVRFLDGSETWCRWNELKLFGSSTSTSVNTATTGPSRNENSVTNGEEDDWSAVCLICQSGRQPLTICVCGRAYHHACHSPRIPLDGDAGWRCKMCVASETTVKIEDSEERLTLSDSGITGAIAATTQAQGPAFMLPSLLQCRRCQRRLRPPNLPSLLPGDKFYKFVCAACTGGVPTWHRPPLRWQDIVHIALYNLTLEKQTKYHELDQSILPWLECNWPRLCATSSNSPSLADISGEERRACVLDALRTVHGKFKCGREMKKRVTLWGLRRNGHRGLGGGSLGMDNGEQQQQQPLQNHLVNSSRRDDSEEYISESGNETVCSTTSLGPGCGLVVRSVPFPSTSSNQQVMTSSTVMTSSSPNAHAARKALRRAARLLRRRRRRNAKSNAIQNGEESKTGDSEVDQEEEVDEGVEEDEDDSHSDQPNSEVLRKRPQRNLLEARLNSTESKLYNPQQTTEDAKKRPADSSAKKKTAKQVETATESVTANKRRLCQNQNLAQTESPTAQLTYNQSTSVNLRQSTGNNNSSDDEDRHFQPKKIILKTRRLREQDIIVDQNGVVRRRRRHRKVSLLSSKPLAVILPPSHVSAAVTAVQPQPTIDPSAFEHRPVSPIDLRQWAEDCFGTITRVNEGERFTLIARRTLNDGRVEGLVRLLGYRQNYS